MELIVIFILFYAAGAAIKRAIRHKPRQRMTPTTATGNSNLSALLALQAQREIYRDLISDIDYTLDNSPPGREKLLKDKAAILSKLATVETKINRLTR